jgi:hypothetical protein
LAFAPLRTAILGAALAFALAHTPAASAQLLQNGGFEQGTSGWSGPGISTSGCAPRSGAAALSVASFAQQSLAWPPGNGVHSLQGWLKAQSAPATAGVALVWLDGSGAVAATTSSNVIAGSDYAAFSLKGSPPPGAQALRVRITGAVCLDDLGLDGPQTPTATATPSPPAQSTAGLGAAATPAPASTATPAPSATARPAAPASEAEAEPSPSFRNGGFEDGLLGWSKFGGELSLISSPVHSGTRAARLVSTTGSTKWAYQTVLVDAALTYEFAGYAGGDAGVASAYLRVSWYASPDGSGAAISTADSTTAIAGATGFTYLSTGAVTPPPGARSARPRVMLTPLGSAQASIVFDDLWFGSVAQPLPAAEPSAEATPTAATASGSARSNAAPALEARVPSVTPEARSAAAPGATPNLQLSGALPASQAGDRGVPLIWLAAAGAFVLGLVGSLMLSRHKPR